MKAKSPSKPAARADLPAWGSLASVGAQPAAAATECAALMFRGIEEMRKVQEGAAHDAAERHAAIAEKLKQPLAAGDVLALQAELLQFDMEHAAQYWQQLAAVALEMQTRMVGSMGQLVDSAAVLEATSRLYRLPDVAAPQR